MPFNFNAPSFFGKLGPQSAGFNPNNAVAGFQRANSISGAVPNLFTTIQMTQKNQQDRRVKEAAIAQALVGLLKTKAEIDQAPLDMAYKKSQIDQAPTELGIKKAELANKEAVTGLYKQMIDGSGKSGLQLNGLSSAGPRFGQPSSFVVFDPNTGEYKDADGNVITEFAPNTKVRNAAVSPDTFGKRAQATGNVAQSFFKEPEIVDMRDINDTAASLSEVRSGLARMGVMPNNLGGVEMESVDSNFGPISIPARFNLAAQYAKDPKYTSVKQKLERSFNKYRKIITGAQASNQELQTLRQSFASFTDRPETFFENLATLEAETKRMLTDRLDMYDAIGRDTTKIRKTLLKRGSGLGPQTTHQPTDSIDNLKLEAASAIAAGADPAAVAARYREKTGKDLGA